jgi:protein-tyrosine phosphatase
VIKVLFVCMGNICRSPTAEFVFRQRAERAELGDRLEVRSAGTHGYHEGEGADPRAEAAAAERGYDLAAHRARRVRPGDFHEFDYIVAMDRDNLEMLDAMAPDGACSNLSLFLAHLGADEEDVPDPYYGGAAGFDNVIDLVEEASDAFLEILRRDLSGASERA